MSRQAFRRLKIFGRALLVLALLAPAALPSQPLGAAAPAQAGDGWGKYTDAEFGWSIGYPSTWSAEVTHENLLPGPAGIVRRKLALGGADRAIVWVDLSLNPSLLSAREWFTRFKQPLLSTSPDALILQDAVLDGQPAVFAIDDQDPTASRQVALVAVRLGIAIEITYVALDGGAARDDFSAIVESFRWAARDGRGDARQPDTAMPALTEAALPAAVAVTPCCGIASPGNPCYCCTRDSDGKQVGNCVWWACHKRRDVPCAGNPQTWPACAERAGKRVDDTPEVGDVIVWLTGQHVAYVEKVNTATKQVYVSEMNCWSTRECGGDTGYNGVSYRWTPWADKKFIHMYAAPPPPTPPPCPTTGGDILLYADANYSCAGRGENSGYVALTGKGVQNLHADFNDRASSVRVRAGWSVKLYENINKGGGWSCRDTADDTFWGDRLSNGVALNDSVSSVEIFDVPHCGANLPPAAPTLLSPADATVVRDARGPTLCWNAPIDPDGDPLGYTVDVTGPAGSAASGWITATCWRPAALDGLLGAYQWRVKARDTLAAESGWSAIRRFTIDSYNAPPAITLDTANGSTAASIVSRDRTWVFAGKASDAEGQIARIEYRCTGEGCGSAVGHTDAATWTHTQGNLSGTNDVYFSVYDAAGLLASSRHVALSIDYAAPTTTLSLNGEAGAGRWPQWFTMPVQVRLTTVDNATGSARAGLKELRWRLDEGAWQTQAAGDVTFDVPADGVHTVNYSSVDLAGNEEAARTVTFRVDRTPPGAPTGLVETHGIASGVWQSTFNNPVFRWSAPADAASGVWGYQLYFGTDPAGTSYQSFLATDRTEWAPQPSGLRTGTYFLRGRTQDNAGNWSGWVDLFTLRYDGSPPPNPASVVDLVGGQSNSWQARSNWPEFSWEPVADEGAGIQGYQVYWGTDPTGTSQNLVTTNHYRPVAPLCASPGSCTGYLRLRSRDAVGLSAAEWSTAFIWRYDGISPVADFTFQEGITTTRTLVHLDIRASDLGSGLRDMRLSSDGNKWGAWEGFVTEKTWALQPLSGRLSPVYLEVRDAAGGSSGVISHTIYLDTSPGRPHSAGYRLFDYALGAGAGSHSSPKHTGHSTLGEVVQGGKVTSQSFMLLSGYEAGSQARPLNDPGSYAFQILNGLTAAGGIKELRSSRFTLVGVLGEPGLPSGTTTLASQTHRLTPGFLAARPSPRTSKRLSAISPPAYTEAEPSCAMPSVVVDDGATFTARQEVKLNLCAVGATEMMISNDSAFTGAQWEPYATARAWTVEAGGSQVAPRFVYVAFRNADGTARGAYFDDILYDPNPPSASLTTGNAAAAQAMEWLTTSAPLPETGFAANEYLAGRGAVIATQPTALLSRSAEGLVDLYISAADDNSGVEAMQIGESEEFEGVAWEPYSALKPFTPAGGDGIKTIYARFRDYAGNVSAPALASFALDSQPPIGEVAVEPALVGPGVNAITLLLAAEDNLSGVADLRYGADPTLAGSVWMPFTTTLTLPIDPSQPVQVLYVQFRDLVGNPSEIFPAEYGVDMAPPVVYVEVGAGDTRARELSVFAYDELSGVARLRISNDPLMIDFVEEKAYAERVPWKFDDRRVVWVQVADGAGNWSEPFPAALPE